MRASLRLGLLAALLAAVAPHARAEDAPGVVWPEPGGRATIARPFGGSTLAVGVSSRTAGAIDSLTWGGTQFINAHDHGRELQSASSYDGYSECQNPTEAGSDADGPGPRSTSLLQALEVGSGALRTRARMAWWMPPEGNPAGACPKGPGPYAGLRSDDVLEKRVVLGAEGVDNAVAYRATFVTAKPHASAAFEAATAYMPPEFSRFWSFDPATGRLAALSPGPGEQPLPVILATADGARAMGVYSPALPQAAHPGAGYGRFDFAGLPGPGNATVKWNCVFRETDLPAGAHAYTCYVLVGTLRDVQAGMTALRAALAGRGAALPQARTGAAAPRGRDAGGEIGVALYVGTEPNCNAGVVTVDPGYGGCATAPVGATLARPGSPGDVAVYAGTEGGPGAGVVTSDPRHLDAATRPIGFLAAPGARGASLGAAPGTPLYVGTQAACNAGVVSTNPAHLNCRAVSLGTAAPLGTAAR